MSKRLISKIWFGNLFAKEEKEGKIESLKAKFTYNADRAIKEETTINFINTSENAQDFVWDFGDGNVSTDPNPKHKYRKGGEYRVKLIALNDTETDSSKLDLIVEL